MSYPFGHTESRSVQDYAPKLVCPTYCTCPYKIQIGSGLGTLIEPPYARGTKLFATELYESTPTGHWPTTLERATTTTTHMRDNFHTALTSYTNKGKKKGQSQEGGSAKPTTNDAHDQAS